VIELVELLLVVEPNPFKPDEVEVTFFFLVFDFFASRVVVVVAMTLRDTFEGLNDDTDVDARNMNAVTAIFILIQ
jgi:hypothetical protein